MVQNSLRWLYIITASKDVKWQQLCHWVAVNTVKHSVDVLQQTLCIQTLCSSHIQRLFNWVPVSIAKPRGLNKSSHRHMATTVSDWWRRTSPIVAESTAHGPSLQYCTNKPQSCSSNISDVQPEMHWWNTYNYGFLDFHLELQQFWGIKHTGGKSWKKHFQRCMACPSNF